MGLHRLAAACIAAFTIIVATSGPSHGQAGRLIPGKSKAADSPAGPLTKTELEGLIEAARKKGVQIIVIAPKTKTAAKAGASTASRFAANVTRVENEIKSLVGHLPRIPASLSAAVKKASPDGTASHFAIVGLIVIALMLVAGLVERAYLQWIKKKMRTIWPAAPPHMPGKMSFLLLRFVARSVGFVLFGLVVLALAAAIFDKHPATAMTVLVLLLSVIVAKAAIEFWRIWISPDLPEFRLPPLDDEQAIQLFRWLAASAVMGGLVMAGFLWLRGLGLDPKSGTVGYLMGSGLILIFNLVLMGRNRRIVAGLLGAAARIGPARRLRGVLGANWHIVLGIYFTIAWLHSSARQLLGDNNAVGPVAGMLVTLMAALTFFALGVVAIDWVFHRRKNAPKPIAEEAEDPPARGAASKTAAIFSEDEDARQRFFGGVHSFEGLAKQALRFAIIGLVIGGLLMTWGVDLTGPEGPLVRLLDVIFVFFAGYIAYQSVRILIAQKIEEEGGFEEPEPGEEGSAVGVSRLATLLPLFRNFILAAIVAIAGMIGLSELGIDVAPLFAGAGVIGLAIGFGAQTLIRDIFSGAFFLVDDAFRKGEYIDVGAVKGTVERISVRSMQVRHHNGPLHTIPFGEVKYLTNFSRDWVMMKLSLRLTYDTDIEKVRKLIKNLGQELLDDPVIGDKFLQPLKSQGVLAMEESAMIVRVKFMCKPGEQFVMRRQVYAAIQELFARENIKFAHREVTVHVAEDDKPKRTAPRRRRTKAAAAAAAQSVIADAGTSKGGGDQR